MESFIAQLKQRQVFKVATIYAVSAWPLIQIADLSVPALGLPDSVMTLLLQIFIAGFPICLIFAWLFNITSKGIVRATSVDEPSAEPQANIKTTVSVAGSLVLVTLATLGTQFAVDDKSQPIAAITTPVTTPAPTYPLLAADESKESIAVLPFIPFSNDKEDEYFADGMVEELLNLLARIPELQVAARTSSFAYKGVTNKTIPQIGRELGVNTILEGSIRKNDTTNKIRVTAQLIKVSTGEHLWSETYDREYRDVFQIQDDIASAVVKKMELTLLGSDGEETQFVAQTNNVDAMVAFGKAQQELSHRTAASLTKALALFKEAIRLDPNYARAYVGVADANNLLPLYGTLSMTEGQANAREAIDNALAIDSQLGEAYAAQGLMLAETDNKKAEESFKQAIALNPSYAMAYMWYASVLKGTSDAQTIQKMYEKAFELDPKSPVAAYNVAWQHFLAGDEDKAMALFSDIIANDPYYPAAYNLVGMILSKQGRIDQAMDMFKRTLSIDAVNKGAIGGLLMASMDMGDLDGAWRWFEYAERRDDLFKASDMNFMKARYYAIKGDRDQAVAHLEKISFDDIEYGKGYFAEGEKAYYLENYAGVISAYGPIFQEAKGEKFYHAADGQAPLHLAYAYQQLNQPDKATEVLNAVEQRLLKDKKRHANNPEFYYKMAMVKSLQHKKDDVFYYMQGAINVGWIKVWEAELEPIFRDFGKETQFVQMMGGIKARLATMRTQLEASEDEFMLAENDTL